MMIQLFAVIGAQATLNFAKNAYQFLTFHFVKPAKPLSSYKKTSQSGDTTADKTTWALITGSSAGIGLGIAQELILQGFGVILHGHLPDELAEAKDHLLKYGQSHPSRKVKSTPQIEIRVLDARTATEEDLNSLVNSISHLDVSILVNNVGGNAIREPNFLEVKDMTTNDIDTVIDQNARFMSRLTCLMLPSLAKTPKALIINFSSAGKVGCPWLVMYSATKAFNHGFSVGLGRELKLNPQTEHIDCICVIPHEVKSQGNSKGVPSGAPNWDQFGRDIVQKVDNAVRRGEWEVRPHLGHGIEAGILNGGLDWLVWWIPGLDWKSVLETGIVDTIRRKRDAWWEFKGAKVNKDGLWDGGDLETVGNGNGDGAKVVEDGGVTRRVNGNGAKHEE
ncbi:very-long-chain 3-oxoacyl-CoA reductase [Rhypophila sp. PSN 637]